MPLTEKGTEIMNAMQKQYGTAKGKSVFYASKNKGTITGVDSACPQHGYMDACLRGDSAGMSRHAGTMVRGRITR